MYIAICSINLRTPCITNIIFQQTNCLPTDEFPSPTAVAAGYNWTQLISILVLVAVIGAVIGIWWLLLSVGKP